MRPSVSLEGDRVTLPLDQAARLKQLNKPDATNANETSGGEELVPGVFLMANSLETGGGERQFAALARSLDPAAFRLHLGCIQQRGPFLDSLGEGAQFRLGKLVWLALAASTLPTRPPSASMRSCHSSRLRFLYQSDTDSRGANSASPGRDWQPATAWGPPQPGAVLCTGGHISMLCAWLAVNDLSVSGHGAIHKRLG
jgi:hypothetical protein